jgi:cytidylate kinase
MRNAAQVQAMYDRIKSEIDRRDATDGLNEEDHVMCIQDAFIYILNAHLPESYLDGYFRSVDDEEESA